MLPLCIGHRRPDIRVFPRPVSTCVRNVGTCVRKLSGRRPLPRPKGEPARGSGGMLPRKILKVDVAKTAIFRYFYAFRPSKKLVVYHPRFSTKFGRADGFFFIFI